MTIHAASVPTGLAVRLLSPVARREVAFEFGVNNGEQVDGAKWFDLRVVGGADFVEAPFVGRIGIGT